MGGHYSIWKDSKNDSYLVDEISGNKSLFKDFEMSVEEIGVLSPDESKISFGKVNEKGYTEIGVLEIAQNKLWMFERESAKDLNEYSFGWFDDDQMLISATNVEWSEFYLYIYEYRE